MSDEELTAWAREVVEVMRQDRDRDRDRGRA
jgi:hypothetical protein